MSKRALEAGLKRYPERIIGHTKSLLCPSEFVDANVGKRIVFMEGYMQAEKDIVEMMVDWLDKNWRNYIMGPDADGCIAFGHWKNDFRKAIMEEE